jgi:hypothetical protein
MSYTPSPRQSSNPTLYMPTNFGPMRQDPNKRTIDEANVFQTQDATASPVTSPVTLGSGTTTLTTPPAARAIYITPITDPVQVSEDSTMSTYDLVPAGTKWRYPCADQVYVYLKGTSSALVYIAFEVV